VAAGSAMPRRCLVLHLHGAPGPDNVRYPMCTDISVWGLNSQCSSAVSVPCRPFGALRALGPTNEVGGENGARAA